MPTKDEITLLLLALDECIIQYVEECRERLPSFIARHFSLHESWQLLKRSLAQDLILLPLNTLWAIPYMTLKKSIETLDKIGWKKLTPLLEKLPSGIRTQQQRAIEEWIANELLEWPRVGVEGNTLWKKILAHPGAGPLAKAGVLRSEWFTRLPVRAKLSEFTSTRALVADLAVSLGALLIGRKFFGNGSLGVSDLGNRFARKMAQDKAASDFFLGQSLGSAYYRAFPPMPTRKEVVIATLLVGGLLTLVSLVASVVGDPLRKRLGFQETTLGSLIDGIDEVLVVQLHRRVRQELEEKIRKAAV
jgi:hypothetical protein